MRTSAPYFGEAPRLSSESLKNVFPKETTSSLEKTRGRKHVLDTEEKSRFGQAVPVKSGQLSLKTRQPGVVGPGNTRAHAEVSSQASGVSDGGKVWTGFSLRLQSPSQQANRYPISPRASFPVETGSQSTGHMDSVNILHFYKQ